MDMQIATILANHATILANQDHVIEQLNHQHDCTERLKDEVSSMVLVVEDIRQIMTTLKMMGAITKWAAVVSGLAVSLWHAIKAGWHFWK